MQRISKKMRNLFIVILVFLLLTNIATAAETTLITFQNDSINVTIFEPTAKSIFKDYDFKIITKSDSGFLTLGLGGLFVAWLFLREKK